MVLIENILFLSSCYILTVQAQLQTDVNCKKFPLNPLCAFSQLNRLSLETTQESLETHRSLDLKSDHARDQKYFIQTNNQRPPNSRSPNNFAHRPGVFNNHRLPIVQNTPNNFRPTKRPKDSLSTPSNRKKRFFFWYNPADIIQAKKNHWKNKFQQMKENVYQWKQPQFNNLQFDEYDCVHGKLNPLGNNVFSNVITKPNKNYLNWHGQPVILASPLFLNEQYAAQNKPMKTKKKAKPMKYAVEMEENSNEGSEETKMSYMRDHAPETTEESNDSEESGSENLEKLVKKKQKEDFELSPHGERIEFQVQGHNGPKTYIFGFDTGDGKNRQYRLEERLKDGTVKGQYGYYDARGKLRTIKYVARPLEGYKEKHHKVNLSDLS